MDKPDQLSNGQVRQSTQELPPSEGNGGFVGAETGPALGMNVISGKKGYVKNSAIWDQQSSRMGVKDNTGSADGDAEFGGQDSTDEKAPYKRIQQDEGLPQTFRDSDGAGDAGPSGSDEPDSANLFGGKSDNSGNENTQSVPSSDSGDHEMSDMPQTEFTHTDGGGAPRFKH